MPKIQSHAVQGRAGADLAARLLAIRPAAGLPLLALGASLLLAGAAFAQTTPGGAAPTAPNMPPPATTVPEKIDPPLDPAPDTTGTLSDKLNQTDGVIKPPSGIDPEIHKPAPGGNAGRMPVIPPPGSPGGSSNVDPK